jgi:RNA polymerase sigma-70 factor (ECF subfamily)
LSLNLTEHDLVRRAAAGDAEALTRLVDEQAPHLFKIAYAMTGRVVDAEDLVQETLLAAIAALGSFRGGSKLRTWLVGIMIRQAALVRRKARSAPEVSREPGGFAAGVDAKMDVASALGQLSPEHREVLVLRELEGLSYDEMAAVLNIPRGTVESRLHRARQELKIELRDYQEES